jgi:lactoylglutathione lyase
MTTVGLQYIVLRCRDLEPSRAFYEALGLRPVAEQHGGGARHYSCALGDMVIELYPLAGKPSSGVRLGLLVDDIPGIVALIAALGAEIVRCDAYAALLRDPDGHEVALARRV